MGTITLAVLILTLSGMAFGALFGFIRGRERALLRLVLVIISATLAIVLRGVIFDAVMNIDVGGSTLNEALTSGLSSGDTVIPEGLKNLILALFEIVVGFVSYFILLFTLRFLTWLLVFPFLKLIIRRFESEYAGNKGQGALIGVAQGLLVSYFLFAPLTCLLTQVNRIASLEINGNALLEIPDEIGIDEYTESFIGKFYSTTGHWYYDIMTTTTDANGNKVSLDSTLDSVAVILEVANVASSLEDDLKIFNDENATPEEKINSINSLADKLIYVGTSLGEIDESTKNMIEDLLIEMSGEDASQEDIDEMLDNLSPELFTQAGNAMKTYAEYEQIKLDGATLEQDKADEIVKNAYSAIDLVGEAELEVNEADKATFKAAIDSNEDIAAEDVEKMYKIFGISVE